MFANGDKHFRAERIPPDNAGLGLGRWVVLIFERLDLLVYFKLSISRFFKANLEH
jgi:hypothetical protein